MFLREGTRVFVDIRYKQHSKFESMAIPDDAIPATVLYLADRVARLLIEQPKKIEIGRHAVLYRKVKFGLFGVPVIIQDGGSLDSRTMGARLLNPGAVLQRRDTIRIATDLEASVFVLDDNKATKNFTASVADISQGGLRLIAEESLETDNELRVTLVLGDNATTFKCVVRSVVSARSYGLEFVDIQPDGARALRKFIVDAQIRQKRDTVNELSDDGSSDDGAAQRERDAYWDLFGGDARDSLSVSTSPLDFKSIVFGAFESFDKLP